MTRDEIHERYGWKEGEREQAMQEVAERQKKLDSERVLAEAHQANADLRSRNTVTKDYMPPRRAAAPAPATLTADWQRYIAQQINAASLQSDECMAKAIAQTIGANVVELEKTCATLRDQVRSLELELAELKRAAELHNSLSSIAERLDRLEASRSGMKVIPGKALDRDAMIG